MSISILALSSWHSAVTPWWLMAGTASDRWDFVYLVTAQTSSPSALLRKPHSLCVFLIALFRACFASVTVSCLPSPLLLFLMARPSSLLFALMSSFHQRFDLAQMVMTRVCSSKTP